MTTYQSFKRIPDFWDYMVGNHGEVYNTAFSRWMTFTPTQHGELTVGLTRDGRQYRRSVKVLVARAFVPGESMDCDTPILLDGDRRNLRADNIVWRPRWFAWHYAQQFKEDEYDSWAYTGPVIDEKTGVVYETVIDAAIGTGSLITDIKKSLLNKTKVYPHGATFAYKY